jgi:hypothetical protein
LALFFFFNFKKEVIVTLQLVVVKRMAKRVHEDSEYLFVALFLVGQFDEVPF